MSGDYWASTKSPVHLFRRSYESPELAKYLTENSFIDPALLVQDTCGVGLNTVAVEAYQRRLGVRRIAPSRRRPA